MNYMYKEKQNKNQGLLSATRPNEAMLRVHSKQETQLKTKLKQKKKIVIYMQDKMYFVEHATAFALGLINTRTIMLDRPKLVEISSDIHNRLCENDEIEINYVLIENKKQKLKVFVDDSSYYIETGAAYALGLLTVEEYSNAVDNYYDITKSMLPVLQNNYDVEIYSLKLFEETSKKHR